MVNIGNTGPHIVFGLAFDGIRKAGHKRRIHAGLFGLKSMHAFRRHRIILLYVLAHELMCESGIFSGIGLKVQDSLPNIKLRSN